MQWRSVCRLTVCQLCTRTTTSSPATSTGWRESMQTSTGQLFSFRTLAFDFTWLRSVDMISIRKKYHFLRVTSSWWSIETSSTVTVFPILNFFTRFNLRFVFRFHQNPISAKATFYTVIQKWTGSVTFLVRIRIGRSVPLNYGYRPGSCSLFFSGFQN